MKALSENTMNNSREWLYNNPQKGTRTPVIQLKMGMYVTELDRPWMGTPFATQGVMIDHPDKIGMLAEYCQFVYTVEGSSYSKRRQQTMVKPIQSLAQTISPAIPFTSISPAQGRQIKGRNSVVKKRTIIQKRKDSNYNIQLSVEEEHGAARLAYSQAKSILEGIVIAAQYGSEIDAQHAEEAVRLCRESVVRNPDALVWMSRKKHENSYVIGHGLSVCILAMAFGRHLNFTESELDTLGLCGLLHDIGKVQIPAHIQNKQGTLTSSELRLIKQHAVDGYNLLREHTTRYAKLTDVTLSHHERPDGKGYPRNLKCHEISDYAKIIAVVEAYDAMTSDRCYADKKSPGDAHKELYQNLGQQFDEEYALQFMRAIGPYPPGTIVELHNGMVGIVLTGHAKFRHLPTVILSRNVDKKSIDEEVVDLSLTDTGSLDKGFLIRRALPDGAFGVSLENHKI